MICNGIYKTAVYILLASLCKNVHEHLYNHSRPIYIIYDLFFNHETAEMDKTIYCMAFCFLFEYKVEKDRIDGFFYKSVVNVWK